MIRGRRIAIGAGCAALLMISWIIAAGSKSDTVKQMELMEQASALINDGIYVRAVPLLEEAASYRTKYTAQAEEELKTVYLALIDTSGYRRKYTNLLEAQMRRIDVQPSIFAEAANYYFGISRVSQALDILRNGIAKTGCESLVALYEQSRYVYEINRRVYESVSAIYGSTAQVMSDGLWGIASSDGTLLIPCEYEKISTFDVDRAIVQRDNEIYAINADNNRVSLLQGTATDFGNLSNDRIPIMMDGSWRRATGEFAIGTASFEQFGMYSEGYAAAKTDGRWGVIDVALNWLIQPEYDEIIQDELGRCYAAGAVFARKNNMVYLFVNGLQVGETYNDARPFSADGYAAVNRNGIWGFVDRAGTVVIDFEFDDALSFGQHLAAVKLGGLWGYISLSGEIAIMPVFLEAKSFSNGSAPVLTERGWQFITLIEYKGGPSL